MVESIAWIGNEIQILDQSALPSTEKYEVIRSVEQLVEAIRALRIRGAPALGIAGAMGIALGSHGLPVNMSRDEFIAEVGRLREKIVDSRPTAVNLRWGADRVIYRMKGIAGGSVQLMQEEAAKEALSVLEEDRRLCERIARHGSSLISDGMTILTHCNTGSLATGGVGTALGILKTAFHQGKKIHVIVDETRPLLQGSRLTAWELQREGIPHTLICDNMAGYLMKEGRIGCAFVGADRIAANGDTANKIGTYSLAALCRYHHIPFYVAAPYSTIDIQTVDGGSIPIELRNEDEVIKGPYGPHAPSGTRAYNPAFDITPHDLITAIITEEQVFQGPLFRFSA